MNYTERSKQVILDHQDPSGAFVASPSFDHYRYSWLRDGTFIAHSLDLMGEKEAAERFFRWAAQTIERYRHKLQQVVRLAKNGKNIPQESLLHARYTVEGKEVEGEWGTFQLDGYGTWIWGLTQHFLLWNDLSLLYELKPTVRMVSEYLKLLWQYPNFDCWEEHGDRLHPSTLAAVYGGLQSSCVWLEEDYNKAIAPILQDIRQFLLNDCVFENRFTKSVGNSEIDASLLWLHVPFRIFDGQHPLLSETVRIVEKRLFRDGGVHRYPQDAYYGGGQWVLLTAWLGWHYAELGQQQQAKEILTWVRAQFNEQGFLPEQVQHHLLAPQHFESWKAQWGPPACPLLWSHAMHIILEKKCGEGLDFR